MDPGLLTSPNQFPDLAFGIKGLRLSVKLFQYIQPLSDILPVSRFHIALLYHGVMQSGVNLLMS